MFVHVFFMFPKTTRKTLEEVKDPFTDPHGPKYIETLAWKIHFSTKMTRATGKREVGLEKETVVHSERRGSDSK